MEIKRINKEEAWKLRHEVMWPHKDLEYIKLKDDDSGIHLGLFKENILISIISLFIDDDECQFRKFATVQEEQGKGYGSRLLNYALKEMKDRGVKRIWCNARKDKADFYKKFGLKESEYTFEKGGISYIIMEEDIS